MNIYTLVLETAQALRAGEPVQQASPVKSGYAVANGAGIELLSQAIEYGIEGDSLDARIEQWRADSPVADNTPALVEAVEQVTASLGKAYSNRRPVYKGSKYFFYMEQPKPDWNAIRWQLIKDEFNIVARHAGAKSADIRAHVTRLIDAAEELTTDDARFTPGWTKEALVKYDELYFQLIDKYPGLPKGLPSIDWVLRHKVINQDALADRFACQTSPEYLGEWRKPEALRIARSQSWVMVKNGEMEGKAEYLAKLSQYDAHPEFGPWIERWLDTHQPVSRTGLGHGVKFRKGSVQGSEVGFVTQPSEAWKIPAAQVVEHWASDTRLVTFQPCKDKKGFAKHCQDFWQTLESEAKEHSKLLVLLPEAVLAYRAKRKA